MRRQKKIQSQRGGLIEFVRYFWDVLEPETELVEGWPLLAICDHLEAVTFGEINRLLINVPPGFCKSLLTDVFFPAWEWGAMNRPHLRYVAFSYASGLTERDNGKFRDLLMSAKFKELWGDRFELNKIGETRVTNDKTGSKLATSVGGIGTGERGDRALVDDAHNIKEGESEIIRSETGRWFRESLSNRLNDMHKSAIIVIMQRVHEADISGIILESGMDYEHLMIPMEYDESRHCSTCIGWTDPRSEPGELAWPERFSADVVEKLSNSLGPYAYAAQYDQAPAPRGGGIFKAEWWQTWDSPDGKFPIFDYIVASLDSAFTEREENDPSGFTVWGVWCDSDAELVEEKNGRFWRRTKVGKRKVMLIHAWRKHLQMHGEIIPKEPNEHQLDYIKRAQPHWGLVEHVAHTCRRFKVDKLLIEAKASGITAAQEMRRLYGNETWTTQLEQVKGDKVSRAHAVVPAWSQGLIYAPDRDWSDMVISEMATFPKGRYKDLTDSATQAIKHLRSIGLIQHEHERQAEDHDRARQTTKHAPLYPA